MVEQIAIFASDYFLSLGIDESVEMFVVDIFDVDPLYFEMSFEFEGVVLPPERKGFFVVA